MSIGMSLQFYTSVVKGSKLKVREILGLILTFVEVTKEKLVGNLFAPATLNGVKL